MKDWDELLNVPEKNKSEEEKLSEKLEKLSKKVKDSPKRLHEIIKKRQDLLEKAEKKGYDITNFLGDLPFTVLLDRSDTYKREETKNRYKTEEVKQIINDVLEEGGIIVIQYDSSAGLGGRTRREFAIFGTNDVEKVLDSVGNEAKKKLKQPPKTYENGIFLKTEPQGFTWSNIEEGNLADKVYAFTTTETGKHWQEIKNKLKRG